MMAEGRTVQRSSILRGQRRSNVDHGGAQALAGSETCNGPPY